MTRRDLIRRLLLLLGIEAVAPARGAGRRGGEAAAQPVDRAPAPPPERLSRTELDSLLGFGEIVVEGRPLPAAELAYLASHIEERAAEASGYHRAHYRTAVGLLDRLAGSPFSSLGFDQRTALVARHRLTVSRVLPDEDLGPFPEDARAVRTRVVPDLIAGYYRSPAGWAVVGYDVFPGPVRRSRALRGPGTIAAGGAPRWSAVQGQPDRRHGCRGLHRRGGGGRRGPRGLSSPGAASGSSCSSPVRGTTSRRRGEYVRRYLRHQNPWETSPARARPSDGRGPAAYRLEGRRARGVGGSTLHWEGYALRLHASDFRLRSLYGIADDWPISYADLETYYGAAERTLGVAGADDEHLGLAPQHALPACPRSLQPFRRPVRAGVRDGWASPSITCPRPGTRVAYGGRPPCRACATCAVCPTGAKASIDLTHIPQAEATGNAQIVTEATVLRLETTARGRRAPPSTRGRDKVERRLTARVFVVAAGAVENARLLLLSASRDFPAGLANRSGLVGKFFMSHPSIDVIGRARENVYPYRIGFSTAMSRQFAIERDRATRGAFLLEFLNSAGPTPERIAVASGLSGEALRQHVRDEFGHWLGIRVYCEQLPTRANAVSLAPGREGLLRQPRAAHSLQRGPVRAKGARRGQGRRDQDPDGDGSEPDPGDRPDLREPPDRDPPDGHRSAHERGRRQSEVPRRSQPVPRGQRVLRHRERLTADAHHRGARHPSGRAHRGAAPAR